MHDAILDGGAGFGAAEAEVEGGKKGVVFYSNPAGSTKGSREQALRV